MAKRDQSYRIVGFSDNFDFATCSVKETTLLKKANEEQSSNVSQIILLNIIHWRSFNVAWLFILVDQSHENNWDRVVIYDYDQSKFIADRLSRVISDYTHPIVTKRHRGRVHFGQSFEQHRRSWSSLSFQLSSLQSQTCRVWGHLNVFKY